MLFDVTGSMGNVPRTLQTKLPDLLGLLLRKGYVRDPHILFGAVGDATCDRAPLQIGQFEADNRMDDDLGKILLEGGGGGQMRESYELAMYFMARHTAIDCFEKRGKRGYLFMIGDELAYPKAKRREIAKVIGDERAEDVPIADLVRELQRKYDVYFIIPEGAYHSGSRELTDFWRKLLGQNVLYLDDLDAVCETIALTIGLAEDAIDLDEGLEHLAEATGRGRVGVAGPRPAGRVPRAGRGVVHTAGAGRFGPVRDDPPQCRSRQRLPCNRLRRRLVSTVCWRTRHRAGGPPRCSFPEAGR